MPFQMILIGKFPPPPAWGVPGVEARVLFEIGETSSAGVTVGRAKVPFWSPSITDFKAVSGGSTVVGTFVEFLQQIEMKPVGSIEWVSFISHGNKGHIAFSGTIDTQQEDVTFNDTLVSGNLINTPLAQRVERLRDRFTKNCWLDFYLCNTGANVGLLKEIADAFQLQTRGFSHAINYCPQVEKLQPSPNAAPRFVIRDRKRVSASSSCSAVKPSIFLLVPDRVATPKRPGFP